MNPLPGQGYAPASQQQQQQQPPPTVRPTGSFLQQSQQLHQQQHTLQQNQLMQQQQEAILSGQPIPQQPTPVTQVNLQHPPPPVPQPQPYQQSTPGTPSPGMILSPQQSGMNPAQVTAGAPGTPAFQSDNASMPGEESHLPADLGSRIKGIFHKDKPQGPNFGFTPTAAMAQRHEEALVSSKRPLFQFQVTKLRNWRTGYVRLLCFYNDHISTIDPDTHNPTNTWSYSKLLDFGSVPDKDQIILQLDKDKLKFQCHNVDKGRVLTAMLECQDIDEDDVNADSNSAVKAPCWSTSNLILCQRWTRHGTQLPSALKLTPYALVEVHPGTKRRLQTYKYVDIAAVSFTSDDLSGLILHLEAKSTTRLFSISGVGGGASTSARTDVVTAMRQSFQRIGLELRMAESRTTVQWKQARQQHLYAHRNMTIATEYSVTKESRRHNAAIVGSSGGWPGGVVSRKLCLTGQGVILEKDPVDGLVVSSWHLKDLYAIVRPATAGDKVLLEFANGQTRSYSSASRDSLIVSILDAAATLGRNTKVHVSDVPSGGYNLASFAKVSTLEKSGGLFQPISIPQHCLKRVHSLATAAFSYLNSTTESSTEEGQPANPIQECRNVMELCREFNASVLPTAEGLPTSDKDKHVLGSIGALWGLAAELLERRQDRRLAELTAAPMFQTLHRLSKTPAGYMHSIELATCIDCLPLLWTIEDPFCKFWAFRTLTVILSGHPKNRDKEVEYVNKSVILKAGGQRLINGLVNSLLKDRVSDLIPMVMSDILQSILCSFADTTSPEHFSALIQALGENYQGLLNTLYQQTPFVIENAALLLHLLSTHAPTVATAIREAALSSAILLHHFHAAIFSPLEGQRFLSRFLCSLWLAGPMDCDEKKLLRRMVSPGFMGYLKMPALSQVEEEQLDELERDAVEENIPEDGSSSTTGSTGISTSQSGAAGTNTARLRTRIALARATANRNQQQQQSPPENFRIFFHVLTQNHSLPDLIWNQQTRRELRIGLESEIQYIKRETEARGIDQIAWNYQQFGIEYPSLENELRVGNVYMRLWLQAGEGFIKSWDEPLRLFELLFRRFLCEMDRNTKITVMCIRCLERLYSIHGTTIGAFPDVMLLIRSMASTRNTETQHRLLGLLATILGVTKDENGKESTINVPENAEQILNTESIEQLCQFVAWGHTNGVQVGNLMTSVLGSRYEHSGYAMLTDGTDMNAQGDGSAAPVQPQEVPSDIHCPPVWFVAPTGRIPPPSDLVRGPYRVSQLRKMIESGEISQFNLVTSAHVDSYEDEDAESGSSDVKEEQIDTGKWRRLDQVWQLRWQLCTNQNDGGIYSPSEVALLAIRSLTRLVDLHKSLDFRGLPYYPIPIAKRIICGLSRDPFTSANGGGGSADHSESFLSILTQSILCNDAEVVDQAAQLLVKLTLYNEEATTKFYLTGVFFFAVCYTGSNFKSLAELLHSTHLKQYFRSGFAATAGKNELPLKERSILGALLPEGVLYILLNYGVQRFNEVFVGNFDTPEVIWNLDMRKHLIEMVRQHLGDFPKRLWQNTTTKYEYCPMPGVAYKRLEKEIFCHNYYLNNLCDEQRFPDWPIAEPVEVFKACLEEFKKQVNRDETEQGEAIKNATLVLNLKPSDGSKELRKAYRTLARMYHPDKNPAGREMFESIQAAYELLLPLVESGQSLEGLSGAADGEELNEGRGNIDCLSVEGFAGGMLQLQAMQLLIRTQALICRRFESEMSKYKYPVYQILLGCLKIPPSCQGAQDGMDKEELLKSCLMTAKRAEFVKDASELVFRTCLVSPLNAEELVVESGVPILNGLLEFYTEAARALDQSSTSSVQRASDETVAQILATIVHTLAGVAFYANGRNAIAALPNLSQFCLNWRRCLDGQYFGDRLRNAGDTLVKRYALEGVAHMAKHAELQKVFIGGGVVWPLVKYLLSFDPTLDDAAISRDSVDDDIGVSQAASNTQARLAARALGMLCGALQDPSLASPKNPSLQQALDALLTQPIAVLLRNKRTTEILKILNINIETPSRIWNVEMRGDLVKFVNKMISERPESMVQSVDDELRQTSGFEYALLKNELRIGGIYVRLFNQLGLEKGAMREIQDPALFAQQLLGFIARSINSSANLPKGFSLSLPDNVVNVEVQESIMSVDDRRFVMVMNALRILVRTDGLVDEVLCKPAAGFAPVLLSLLELPQESEAFEIGCDILTILSPKEQFADAVANQGALWRLLWVLERPDSREDADGQATANQNEMLRKQRGWMFLESLSSSPSVATKIVESSAWLELLGILVGYSGFTKIWIARTGAAKTLSRLLWDPKSSTIISPLLNRFLPVTLIVVLKEEGADKMLNLFDGESDTPDLIWESSMRTELRKAIGQVLDSCIEARGENGVGDDNFVLDPSIRVKYKKLEDELFIGGVYVMKFLKEPTYNVRDPTAFLEMLMQRWTHELQLCTTNTGAVVENTSTTLALGGQDALQSVTNASVYLCKVRSNLCDKLSQWGYMSRSLSFLEDVLNRELLGTPLLSVMRILHVAVNRRSNVESLLLSGKNDRLHGIVPLTMRAIEPKGLHKDAAFMLEMLKKLFIDALGDVEKGAAGPANTPFYAMAPSPAPGEGPVSRNRVTMGNPLDDPLAVLQEPAAPTPAQRPSNTRQVNNAYQGFQSGQGMPQLQGQSQYPQQPYAYQHGASTSGYQNSSPYAQGNQSYQAQGYGQPTVQYPNSTMSRQGSQGGQAYPATSHQRNEYNNQPQPLYQQPQGFQQQSGMGMRPGNTTQPQASMGMWQGNMPQQSRTMGRGQPHGAQQQAGMGMRQNQNAQYNQQQPMMQSPAQQRYFQPPTTTAPHSMPQQSATLPTGTAPPSFSQAGMARHAQQAQVPNQVQPIQGGSGLGFVQTQQQARQTPYAHARTTSSGRQQTNTQFAPTSQQNARQGTVPVTQQSPLVYAPPTPSGQMMGASSPTPLPADRAATNVGVHSGGSSGQTIPQYTQNATPSAQTMPQNTYNAAPIESTAPVPQEAEPEKPQQPMHGSGLDARSAVDPKEEAARKMNTVPAAPGAADGRVALLKSAIDCELPKFIIESVLENPDLATVKDPAAVKVHGVELLKLLTQDPGYGMKFQQILDDIPAWKKYKLQDHSLFITGPEQKADYFLTDGNNGEAKKLLTQG